MTVMMEVSNLKHLLTSFVKLQTKQFQNQIPTPKSHRSHGFLMSVRKLFWIESDPLEFLKDLQQMHIYKNNV